MNKYLPFIREKKEIVDAYRRFEPLAPITFEEWSRLEFVYISGIIDGGSLSRAEIKQVIEKGLTIGGKTLKEQKLAVIDAEAVDWIRRSSSLSRYDINEQMLISLHHLPSLTEKEEGFLKYTYQVPYVLTEFAEWLHQQKGTEVEVAVAAHNKMLELRPYKDNNPRTARLLMNMLLLMDGYPLALMKEESSSQYVEATKEFSSPYYDTRVTDILFESIYNSLGLYVSAIENKSGSEQGQLLKIGQLAASTHETIPTIRHWTKQGLLKVASQTQGGYQLYHPSMAKVVLKIRELQREKRMKISEIQELAEALLFTV